MESNENFIIFDNDLIINKNYIIEIYPYKEGKSIIVLCYPGMRSIEKYVNYSVKEIYAHL